MTAANRESDSSQAQPHSGSRGSQQEPDLEVARRIALEILKADHHALELEPPGWSPSVVPTGVGTGA
jgi:hypothetical protein